MSNFDFSVYYSDFKEKMTVEEFEDTLEEMGGSVQDYPVKQMFHGKEISEKEYDALSIEETDEVKIVPIDVEDVEVRFYDYTTDSRLVDFFTKNGADYDKAIENEHRMTEMWRDATGYYNY